MGKCAKWRVFRALIIIIFASIVFAADINKVCAEDNQVTSEYDFYVVGANSNLRATPSANGDWVAVVHIGDIVMVTDKNCGNNFYKIKFGELEAYLYYGAIRQHDEATYEDYKAQFPDMVFEDDGPAKPDISELYKNRREEHNQKLRDDERAKRRNRVSENTEAEKGANELRVYSVLYVDQNPPVANVKVETDDSMKYRREEVEIKGKVVSDLKMRSMPSIESEQIGAVPNASEVIILDSGDNGYIHIKYAGIEGYVYSRCVVYDVTDEEETCHGIADLIMIENQLDGAADIVSKHGGLHASGTTMSQHRALAASISASLKTVITTTTVANENIEIADNTVAPVVNTSDTVKENVSTFKTNLIGEKVSMRSLPDNNSNKIVTLTIGTDVVVLGDTHDGYKMVQYNGLTGYVLSSAIVDTVDIEKIGGTPIIFKVTAYCPCKICCGKYSPEITGRVSHTATGTEPEQGRTIAVDPTVIPYGSHVYIDGYGTFIAEDCGGAVKGEHIDMYFDSHEDAVVFGVKRLYVAIIDE